MSTEKERMLAGECVVDVCRVRIGDSRRSGRRCRYSLRCTHERRAAGGQEFCKPIEIGSDVWVGGGVLILPACESDRGPSSVQAASSRDIPEGVFAAGNPCRVIREITD